MRIDSVRFNQNGRRQVHLDVQLATQIGRVLRLQGTATDGLVRVAPLDKLHGVLSHASGAVVQKQDFLLAEGVGAQFLYNRTRNRHGLDEWKEL